MRKKLLFIGLWLLVALSVVASTGSKAFDQKILIVNSYRGEVMWSNVIATGLEEQLLLKYPQLQVHIEYLNANNLESRAALDLMLRSVLWSFAKNSEAENFVISNESTVLQTDTRPDLIVFVGDDGLLAYQNLESELGSWKEIPLVLCAVNDSVIGGEWNPEKEIDLALHIPIENRRQGQFNMTGVKIGHPISKNVDLLRLLMPELEEVVWVSDYYYASEYTKHLLEEQLLAKYPAVKFSSMYHNQWNTDSIYSELKKPVRNRAYLTHAWDIQWLCRERSVEEIESILLTNTESPFFSLTGHPAAGNFSLGGYYLSKDSFIEKTISQIIRVLEGEVVNDIPFEVVAHGWVKLNKELLDRYGLSGAASYLEGVEYVNIPPTFLKKNEKQFLILLLVVIFFALASIYWWRINRYNSLLRAESLRYQKLYNYLQAVYEYAPIDFALYDKNFNCIFCIVNGRAYAGKEIAENDFFSPNLSKSKYLNEDHISKLLNREKIDTEIILNFSQSDPNAEKDVFQLIVTPLDSQKYESVRYVGVCLLLTPILQEKKEKEYYERLFNFATEYSKVGVAYYNLKTKQGKVTPTWRRNLNEPELIGVNPVYENVNAEDREELLKYQKQALNKEAVEPYKKDIRVHGADGREHWIEQHIFVRGEDREYLVELNLNIDLQKQAEEELLEAKIQAEQSNVETELFIQSISHEVRTPLNSIVGFSGVLAHCEDKEEQTLYADPIRQNSKSLEELVENIIEMSELDSGKRVLEKEEVRISYLLEKYRAYFYENLYGKQIRIESDLLDGVLENGSIRTDKKYFYLLSTNFVSNAIKFTPNGGVVTLGYREREDGHYFYVKDTGYGIASENVKRIFKRFEKIDTFSQGAGLGLPLCKRIVKYLGGKMGVESEVGKGSCFWWVIPK